jgi:hypothetical protein
VCDVTNVLNAGGFGFRLRPCLVFLLGRLLAFDSDHGGRVASVMCRRDEVFDSVFTVRYFIGWPPPFSRD